MTHQFTVEEKKKEAYFVRVPKDIYEAIQAAANDNDRSIQLQTHILLGAALNRGLVNPGQMPSSKAEIDSISELHRQIDFLQEVIDKLAKGQRTTVTYTPALPNYIPYWRSSPNITWMSQSGQTGGSLGGNSREWQDYNGTSFSVNTSRLLAK